MIATKRAIILVSLTAMTVACSEAKSPTTPTPITPAPVSTAPTQPVVSVPPTTPSPSTPAPNPLLSDPRFSLAFYRQLVSDAYEAPSEIKTLRRQLQPPRIYIRTVDSSGRAIDAQTLDATSSAIERVTGQITGVFGVAGIERGADTHEGQAGWITVKWAAARDPQDVCGRAPVGGTWIEFYPASRNCRCAGGASISARIVKHEFGHAMGFWHTDSPKDLMYVVSSTCDQDLSERELLHMHLAYQQPNGSLDPK